MLFFIDPFHDIFFLNKKFKKFVFHIYSYFTVFFSHNRRTSTPKRAEDDGSSPAKDQGSGITVLTFSSGKVERTVQRGKCLGQRIVMFL